MAAGEAKGSVGQVGCKRRMRVAEGGEVVRFEVDRKRFGTSVRSPSRTRSDSIARSTRRWSWIG